MPIFVKCRFTYLLLSVFLLSACSQCDPKIAIGKWRAEAFRVGSFNMPISPDIEITVSEVRMLMPNGDVSASIPPLPLEAIRATKNTITLDVKSGYGAGMSFAIESRDRLVFLLPIVGKTVTFVRIPS